jgi:predicted RNase H-like HicB family nuclease
MTPQIQEERAVLEDMAVALFGRVIPEFKMEGRADSSDDRARKLIERYICLALWDAEVKELGGGEGWFGSISAFPGVWADGDSEDAVRSELQGALRSWVELKLSRHDGDIPEVRGINLNAV